MPLSREQTVPLMMPGGPPLNCRQFTLSSLGSATSQDGLKSFTSDGSPPKSALDNQEDLSQRGMFMCLLYCCLYFIIPRLIVDKEDTHNYSDEKETAGSHRSTRTPTADIDESPEDSGTCLLYTRDAFHQLPRIVRVPLAENPCEGQQALDSDFFREIIIAAWEASVSPVLAVISNTPS